MHSRMMTDKNIRARYVEIVPTKQTYRHPYIYRHTHIYICSEACRRESWRSEVSARRRRSCWLLFFLHTPTQRQREKQTHEADAHPTETDKRERREETEIETRERGRACVEVCLNEGVVSELVSKHTKKKKKMTLLACLPSVFSSWLRTSFCYVREHFLRPSCASSSVLYSSESVSSSLEESRQPRKKNDAKKKNEKKQRSRRSFLLKKKKKEKQRTNHTSLASTHLYRESKKLI